MTENNRKTLIIPVSVLKPEPQPEPEKRPAGLDEPDQREAVKRLLRELWKAAELENWRYRTFDHDAAVEAWERLGTILLGEDDCPECEVLT